MIMVAIQFILGLSAQLSSSHTKTGASLVQYLSVLY